MATQSKTRRGQASQRSDHGRGGNGNRKNGPGGGRRRSNAAGHGRQIREQAQQSRQQVSGNDQGLMHRGVSTLTDSVKNHPVPALVVGAGLGYLAIVGLRRTLPENSGTRGMLERAGTRFNAARESTKDALGSAGETIKEGATRAWQGAESGLAKAGSTIRDSAAAVSHGAERAFETGREAVADTWEKHPLMICAAALAAGAAAGLLLPRTRAEDQTLGK
jgi:hypothetical protein